MGADISTDSKSDTKSELVKLKELSPSSIAKLKNSFDKSAATQMDKKMFMALTGSGKRETDIIFEYFDMDANGLLDSYEFICAIAMLVHSSVDLKAEFLFKIYDFDGNEYLTREEVVFMMRTFALASKRQIVNSEIEKRTDDFIKNADLDLDKKISLKEFQSYLSKNRDLFIITDNYSVFLNSNLSTTGGKSKKGMTVDDEDNNSDNPHDDEEHENQFEEEVTSAGDEMDPDLFKELNRNKDTENTSENKALFKQGLEFTNPNTNLGIFEEDEMKADEFGACKPWITNVQNAVPSNYKPSKLDGTTPDANLELEFIHGYRTHDTRNNVRYTSEGKIAYHTAAVGIVYDKESHSQKFLLDHTDDITAFAIHPNGVICATGEIGPYPLIAVWDTTTMKALCKMTGPLQKGINNLAFSKDGKYLVATAADDNHGVAIFDWEKGTNTDISSVKGKAKGTATNNPVIATGDGGKAQILHAVFNNSGDTVALSCVKEVNFISFAGGKLTKKKASGLKGDNLTNIMCGAYINNTLVCGTFKGHLITFAGSAYSKNIKAHSSCVNCIYARDNNTGIITGGNDGLVLVFDSKLAVTLKLSVDNTKIGSLMPKVRTVCEDASGNILTGLRGGEIVEFVSGKPEVLLRGHFDEELWGLTVHPKKDKYYTVGDDCMLAMWDVATRKIEKFVKTEEPLRFCGISPDGKEIAAGGKSCSLYVFDANTLEKKVCKKDIKKQEKDQGVSAVAYSPDGKYLAIGTMMLIYLYSTKGYKLLKKLKAHTSRVIHIDWSEDSDFIQSDSTSYEILYHNPATGEHITSASSMKDVQWANWTCVLGWPVQGIWPPCANGNDINFVDRDQTGGVIASADDFGKVKLFKFPSPVERASFKSYIGHSSHVTCLRFLKSNKYLISTGGNDKAIFQWKFNIESEAAKEAEQLEDVDEDEHIPEDSEGTYFKEEEMKDGDEFGASKPWIGELKASIPSNFKPAKGAEKAPVENIKKLRYVFGYRAFDTRMNIKYTSDSNKIVYHAAALGIVLDKTTNTQKFFTYHEEDVVALAIHPNKKIVATGQMAKAGKAKLIDLYIWDTSKLPDETNCEKNNSEPPKDVINLKGCHLRAIRILQFSPDGTKLLSGGQDDDNSICVHDWAKAKLIVKSPVDKDRILDATWTNNETFVTVGPKHIKFFELKGVSANSKKGVFGTYKPEPLISVTTAFANNSLVTGSSLGNLFVWGGNKAINKREICKGPIYCLYAKDNLLYVGGFDGSIVVFADSKLKEDKKELRLDLTQMTKCDPGIRSIDISPKGAILVGTKGGDIIEVVNKKSTVLMNSHAEEELWAVTVNPINTFLVASGGGDKTLRIWDIKTNRQVKFWMCDQDFRAIDWSGDGKFIVVATVNGKLYYISTEGDKLSPKGNAYESIFITKEKPGEELDTCKKKWIQEMKISPNSKFVAYGSHCGISKTFSKIEVLNVTKDAKNPFTQYAVIDPRITSALTHLDWDVNSDYMVVNSLAFELKFLSTSARKLVNSSSAKDIEWNTWTCLFGFPVQGIWPPDATGYVVNYSCMSNNKKVVATGDDFSLVKLFKSPCVVEKAAYKAYKGHSSHIPKIRFSKDDNFLVSVGGNDKCVFIWETDFGKGIPDQGGNEGEEEEDNNEEEQEHEEQEEGEHEEGENEEGEQDGDNNGENQAEDEEGEHEEEEHEVEEEEPEPEPPKKSNNNNKAQNKLTNNPVPVSNSNSKAKVEEKPTKPNPSDNKSNTVKTTTTTTTNNNKSGKDTKPTPTTSTKNNTNAIPNKGTSKASQNKSSKMVFEDDELEADQCGAPNQDMNDNMQWTSSIEEPDNAEELTKNLTSPLSVKLNLDYVFGYRTKDNHSNLFYLNEENIVYHAGSLGIIHNISTNKQTFFTGHKEEISTFAIDNSKTMIATGGEKTDLYSPSIIVWDTNMKELMRFEGPFKESIYCLNFSPSGALLIAVTKTDNILYIYNTKEKKLVKSTKIDCDYKILDCCFKNENEFITVSRDHYKYWMIREGDLVSKDGVVKIQMDRFIGCCNVNNGNFITGSKNGEVGIWKEEVFVMCKILHKKVVDVIYSKDDWIITGARDYTIVVCDKDLSILKVIKLDTPKVDSVVPMPKSIELLNNKLLLGTLGSEIIQLTFSSGNILKGDFESKTILSSHYSRRVVDPKTKVTKDLYQVKGLCYLPKKDLFATVSEDSTLRIWDPNENRQVQFFRLDFDNNLNKLKSDPVTSNRATCLDIHPKLTNLVIGFFDGSIRIYSLETEFVMTKNVQNNMIEISDVKISPSGDLIAIAYANGNIDILEYQTMVKISSLDGNTGAVNRVDWSLDSSSLASCSEKGELFFYNVRSGKRISPKEICNEEWNTFTRNLGWHVLGLAQEKLGSTFCDRSNREIKGNKLLAVGLENGLVKLTRFPYLSSDQSSSIGSGPGQNVTNLKFRTKSDVLFTSSNDGCLYKWTII